MRFLHKSSSTPSLKLKDVQEILSKRGVGISDHLLKRGKQAYEGFYELIGKIDKQFPIEDKEQKKLGNGHLVDLATHVQRNIPIEDDHYLGTERFNPDIPGAGKGLR
ncbi:hypothetical protein [Legionella gresilensis]|uniref:hypothetical protein n=1 Tax=Legionella gresilensis TaxID=91823 RepID=UPI0010417128|nr:hypothetical protein [Legionella gresilensis]